VCRTRSLLYSWSGAQADVTFLNATANSTAILPELDFTVGSTVQGVLIVKASRVATAGYYHVDFLQVRRKSSTITAPVQSCEEQFSQPCVPHELFLFLNKQSRQTHVAMPVADLLTHSCYGLILKSTHIHFFHSKCTGSDCCRPVRFPGHGSKAKPPKLHRQKHGGARWVHSNHRQFLNLLFGLLYF